MTDLLNITADEKAAIAALKKVAKKWPKSLWLFAASGTLNVMKKNADGERAVGGNNAVDGMDPAYCIGQIKIECDGGDW